MNQTIEQLQARVAELTAEMSGWRNQAHQSQSAYERTQEQLAAAQEEIKRLREAWNAIEINSEECLDFDECTAMLVPLDDYNAMSEALSTPASREALDAYVAEKVKDVEASFRGLHEGYVASADSYTATLTRQRDLAVSAIENLVKQKGRHNTEIAYKKLVEALAAIKESEV